MNRHWRLRDEWYHILHNWPLLAGLFLLGGLLGWAAGAIWPADSRAQREISVALNPYRAYADSEFLALAKPRYSNLDNYHYWQMNQLNAFIQRTPLLKATLEQLRQADDYWNDVDAETLGALLTAEWRTAGAWRLTARAADAQHARQAVEAWGDQILIAVPEAVDAARATIAADQQLWAATQGLQASRLRRDQLTQAAAGLEAWRVAAAGLPAADPLPPEARWRLNALTVAFAQDDPAWRALLDAQPAPAAPAAQALEWSAAVQAQFAAELSMLPGLIDTQTANVDALQADYQAVADASLGLSPNLSVEGIGAVTAEKQRPSSTLALVGAFLGLLGGALAQLVAAGRRAARPIVSADDA